MPDYKEFPADHAFWQQAFWLLEGDVFASNKRSFFFLEAMTEFKETLLFVIQQKSYYF